MTLDPESSTKRCWHCTVLNRLLLTVVLAVAIAAGLTLVGHGRFTDSLVYSLCVGLLCELALDGGSHALARVISRRSPDNLAAKSGWPGWFWMGTCIAVGVPAAYIGGHVLGDLLLGYTTHLGAHWRPNAAMLLVSLSIGLGATFFFKSQGELAATRAEAEAALRMAAEHRLKLLESQLEPHMLFNTLANLRVLIALDPPQAQAMLDHLIAFLRSTLQGSRTTLHPLRVEFERLRDYLALMSVRMGPRLQTHLDLPPELANIAVPTLLLQPLVENAIRHGLEPSLDGGQIRIEARRVEGQGGVRLHLRVFDSGDGLADAAAPRSDTGAGTGTGFGLTQVRERLLALHGAEASLSLRRTDGLQEPLGTLALIDLPLPTTTP